MSVLPLSIVAFHICCLYTPVSKTESYAATKTLNFEISALNHRQPCASKDEHKQQDNLNPEAVQPGAIPIFTRMAF
jgi:hypothetical protein